MPTLTGFSPGQVRLKAIAYEIDGPESSELSELRGMAMESSQGNTPFLPSLAAVSILWEVRVFSQWEEIFPQAIQVILSDH
jgi:hypothetical protein